MWEHEFICLSSTMQCRPPEPTCQLSASQSGLATGLEVILLTAVDDAKCPKLDLAVRQMLEEVAKDASAMLARPPQ